ncbi:hypothetical protein NPIL_5521 [Nephila pilipes]|uniref:Uncharacterized protein n=1 Tax=Nephila pilipes TaxID=299642 RepID=A0A8X6QM41_NEPPI|nr:hypothetical protein NPIL_5521 [Nephila pilipes]
MIKLKEVSRNVDFYQLQYILKSSLRNEEKGTLLERKKLCNRRYASIEKKSYNSAPVTCRWTLYHGVRPSTYAGRGGCGLERGTRQGVQHRGRALGGRKDLPLRAGHRARQPGPQDAAPQGQAGGGVPAHG